MEEELIIFGILLFLILLAYAIWFYSKNEKQSKLLRRVINFLENLHI